MAISLVQHASGTIASATSGTVTFGSATTGGNTVITALAYYVTGGSVSVSGMTLGGSAGNFAQRVSETPSGGPYLAIWEDASAAGGQTAVAVNLSAAAYAAADVYEVSGLVPTGGYLAGVSAAGTGTAWSTGNGPKAGASGFMVGIGAGPGTVTGPATTGLQIPWQNETVQAWSSGGTLGEVSGYVAVAEAGNRSLLYAGTCGSGNWAAAAAFFAGVIAPWPVTPMLTAGFAPQQGFMNQQLAAGLAFAQQRTVFRATQTVTATTITTPSAPAQIFFDTIGEDPWVGWDHNLGAWYTPVSGLFQVTVTVFSDAPPNAGVSLYVYLPGTGAIAATPLPPAAGGCVTGTWIIEQQGYNDGIAAYVSWNNSTGNFSTSLTPGQQSSMEIVYLSTT